MAAFLTAEQGGDGGASTPMSCLCPTLRTAVQERRLYERPSLRKPDLAPREIEVLIAWLLTDNKELVARQLHVSPATVRTHLQRIRQKYAAAGRPARTKAALAARAIQDGLIGIDAL
jgi:DNA-binding CsgD family transcriptional regulator